MSARACASGLFCTLLAACAVTPRSGSVGVSEVDSAVPQETRMALASNETFQPPIPAGDNALPVYPEALLPQALPPQAVCVRVAIDVDGRVQGTEPVSEGPDCPAPGDRESAFFEAAALAIRTWAFEPAFRCVYPEGTTPPDRGCWGEGVREVPQAVSLVYRFVFEQRDGTATVRSSD